MGDAMDGHWYELWATFSVKDHCRRGAFIAEVLLYDKLLIPVLPTEADALSPAEAAVEKQRWVDAGWQPTRQEKVVDVLADRAAPIPWTAARQAEWRESMTRLLADGRRNGYFQTGTVLQKFAPAMARTVVGVSPAYSVQELRTKSGVRRREPEEKLPASALLAVLGYELLMPDLARVGYVKALQQAVEVARADEYRGRRRDLYDWQQRFVRSGQTDASSVEAAVNEMSRLVADLRKAAKGQSRWTNSKQSFSFLGAMAAAAVLAAPVVAPSVAAGGAAVAAVGSFVVEAAGPKAAAAEPGVPAAALILSARRRLLLD
jgi:hypothetical protein